MATKSEYKQPSMTNWYDPRQLSATALKALVSGTFASFADKRELQAALGKGNVPVDCSLDSGTGLPVDEFWIDFISDTGDGFNSTYTVADLQARHLQVKLNPAYAGTRKTDITHWDLPAGNILLLGGDQVYPTPSMQAYETRFKVPFRAASNKHHQAGKSGYKMFAIPGNHDWYDGLGSFIKLFCQQRRIGQWQTEQSRSYYALKLTADLWIWATDVQLNSDIDKPQLDYFRDIANLYMNHDDRVILVTAEPAWVYKMIDRKNTSYQRLRFFEDVFITGDKYQLKNGKKFRLVATLTGDFRHYSRYAETRISPEGTAYQNQLVTAGGGGAFLHPTHNLPQTLSGTETKNGTAEESKIHNPKLEACFPNQKQSRKIANQMLLFPFKNIAFWMTFTAIELLLAWMLQSTSKHENMGFMHQLSEVSSLSALFPFIARHLFLSPPVLLICLFVVVGLYVFADGNGGIRNYKWIGAIHGLVQLFCMFLFSWLFACINFNVFTIGNKLVFLLVYVAETFLIAGLAGSFIMGFYLWFCSLYLNMHIDESFSAFGYPHFKNFLRIHVAKEGSVTIYPIGIEHVVTHWKQEGSGESITFVSEETANYYLIEPPIEIAGSV